MLSSNVTELLKILGGLGWPLAILVIFFFVRKEIKPLLQKENVTLKIGSFEINVADAAKKLSEDVTIIQKEIAEIKNSLNMNEETKIFDYNNDINKSILWVDDYPTNNASIIERLSKDKWHVDCVISTNEAVNRLKNFDYDAIISDLGRVENGNNNSFAGLDLLKILRKENIKIPTLIFAGPRGIENKDKLIDAGATAVTQSGSDLFKFINNIEVK